MLCAWTDLLHQTLEENSFLTQGVMNETFREEDHPLREVVLREPGHDPLLLHVRTTGDIDDQIAKILPVSKESNPFMSGQLCVSSPVYIIDQMSFAP